MNGATVAKVPIEVSSRQKYDVACTLHVTTGSDKAIRLVLFNQKGKSRGLLEGVVLIDESYVKA